MEPTEIDFMEDSFIDDDFNNHIVDIEENETEEIEEENENHKIITDNVGTNSENSDNIANSSEAAENTSINTDIKQNILSNVDGEFFLLFLLLNFRK